MGVRVMDGLLSTGRASGGSDATRDRGSAAATGWWTEIPAVRRRPLRTWLWSVAGMTFGVLVVGGITRLTLSGLSIVDWKPLMGVIPPLNDAQWQATFELYRQFPDYQSRGGMSLDEFRFIFFWEYLHRLLARTIGLVFLVPFTVFWLRGWLTRPLLRRSLLLFALGAMQGVMGWLMVASGLVDRPSVSHYRLAAHLTLAFLIFGGAVWLARDLRDPPHGSGASVTRAQRVLMLRSLSVIGGLLSVQIVWGAFVAGLRAGKYYPTFPLMGGGLVPPDMLRLDATLLNFVANPSTVQWVHRLLGTLLGVAVFATFIRVRRLVRDTASRRYSTALTTLVAAQYSLGVMTLLLLVPVSLGVIHQATAMILFGVWLAWLHYTVRLQPGR
ncbi:MAG: COX15/CtaA family protein [Gemmatimonadota bacterium]